MANECLRSVVVVEEVDQASVHMNRRYECVLLAGSFALQYLRVVLIDHHQHRLRVTLTSMSVMHRCHLDLLHLARSLLHWSAMKAYQPLRSGQTVVDVDSSLSSPSH